MRFFGGSPAPERLPNELTRFGFIADRVANTSASRTDTSIDDYRPASPQAGGTRFEVISPESPQSRIERFERCGEGVHHGANSLLGIGKENDS